jgi:hypothetical protein
MEMVVLVDALSLVNLCMSFLAHGCHGNIQFGLTVGFSFLVFFTATLFFVSGDVSIYASWNWRKLDFNEDHQCH